MGGPQTAPIPCDVCKVQGRWRVFKYGSTRVGRVCPACAYKWLQLAKGEKKRVQVKVVERVEKVKISVPTLCCPRCKAAVGPQRRGLGPFKIKCACGFEGHLVFIDSKPAPELPAGASQVQTVEPKQDPPKVACVELPQGRGWNA